MRVGVDGRFFVRAGGRGVSRVARALLTALAAEFPQDEWRVLLPREAGPGPPGTRARRARLPGRALYGSGALTGWPALDVLLGDVDVVWLPAPAPVTLSGGVPHVLTLHDLSWEERPGDFTRYERLWHRLARPRALAEAAAAVVANSHATRAAALVRWDLDPARISVVHPPLAPPPASSPPDGPAHLLWVGAVEPRKGPDVLAAALPRARARGLRARVVVAGESRLRPWADGGTEWRGYVSDAELARLYAGALALVAPSRLEGLGLPPLEAALHGTPSVLSDLPSFRETLGDGGAVWVPPGDAEALADALVALEVDPDRRAHLGARAREAARPLTDPGPPARALRAVLTAAANR